MELLLDMRNELRGSSELDFTDSRKASGGGGGGDVPDGRPSSWRAQPSEEKKEKWTLQVREGDLPLH